MVHVDPRTRQQVTTAVPLGVANRVLATNLRTPFKAESRRCNLPTYRQTYTAEAGLPARCASARATDLIAQFCRVNYGLMAYIHCKRWPISSHYEFPLVAESKLNQAESFLFSAEQIGCFPYVPRLNLIFHVMCIFFVTTGGGLSFPN